MRVSKNWVKFNKMFTLSPCALTLNFKLKDINLFKNNHSPNLCANPE